jgi:hypothetical protein
MTSLFLGFGSSDRVGSGQESVAFFLPCWIAGMERAAEVGGREPLNRGDPLGVLVPRWRARFRWPA